MTTEKQAVKTIADAIIKASKLITEENNKQYVNNQIKNYGGSGGGSSGGGGGGGSISGKISPSQITGLYNTVAGYIINAYDNAASGSDKIAPALVQSLRGLASLEVAQASIKYAQIEQLDAGIANIIHLAAQTAEIEDATIKQLRSDVADIGIANIGNASITYAQVKDLDAQTAIIREGIGNKLFIDRLAVTEANIVDLAVGTLLLRDDAGNFVQIIVDQEGKVSGKKVEDSVNGEFIKQNSLNATRIIESSITARELNVSEIFADKALIGAITASNIDVSSLFANDAFVNNLHTNIISSDFTENSSIIKLIDNSIVLEVESEEGDSELRLTDRVLSATVNSIKLKADEIDLSANKSIDARVKEVLKDEVFYQINITATSDILSDSITSSTLSAHLFKGTEDVTSQTSVLRFNWKRVSSNASGDTAWNNDSAHIGKKSITVRSEDVQYGATFQCVFVDEQGDEIAMASKAIVDTDDGKVMYLSLGSNLPVTQIYDGNNTTYSPDWSSTNLVVAPTVMINQTSIGLTDSKLSVTYKKRIAGGAEQNISAGESVVDNKLIVNSNVLSSIPSGLITYIATATYTLDDGSNITASESITYSLVKSGLNATSISVDIQGEQVFKYGSSVVPSPESIHLVAVASGCTVVKWQYKASNDTWVDLSASGNECDISYSASIFTNDVATIRVLTNIDGVYDTFSIYKVYNGAKGDTGEGEPAPTVFLTNENITFAGDKNGKVSATSINCNIIAYKGTEKVTPVVGNITGAVSGMTITKLSASDNEIPVRIQVANGATLGGEGQQFGSITIPITSPVSTNLSITWSKVNTGADGSKGDSAVVLSLYTPLGTIFENGKGDLEIVASAYDGANDITSTAQFSWYKFVSGTWDKIIGASAKNLVVNGTTVSGTGTYKCEMGYGGDTYSAMVSLQDKTDNFQAIIESSGGNIFKNTIGQSTLTCRIFQNGKEIDTKEDYYTCSWYRTDKDGQVIQWEQYDASGHVVGNKVARKYGKSIEVSNRDVDTKTTFICEVLDQKLTDEQGRLKTSALFTIVDMSDPVQSGSEPQNPVVDMLWLDTSKTPNELKRWNGSEWVSVSSIDPAVLENKLTTLETSISEQGGEIALRATKEEVSQIGDRVTSTENQIAEIDVRYDDITLAVAQKTTNYRQVTQPENPNAGDIWVKPVGSVTGYGITEKTYQAIGAVGKNEPVFAYDDEGNLVYYYLDDIEEADRYPLRINDNGELQINTDTGTYRIEDNIFTADAEWKELVSNDFALLSVSVNGIESRVSSAEGNISTVGQTADKINWIVKSGTSSSDMELTNDAYKVIANKIDLKANTTIEIKSADQITAEAAKYLDLQANESVRIKSADQISVDAANKIDLSGNEVGVSIGSLEDSVNELTETDNNLKMWYDFTNNGLIIQKKKKDDTGEWVADSKWSTITDGNGYHIKREDLAEYVFSAYNDRVKITKLEIGDIMIKASSNGGYKWVMK